MKCAQHTTFFILRLPAMFYNMIFKLLCKTRTLGGIFGKYRLQLDTVRSFSRRLISFFTVIHYIDQPFQIFNNFLIVFHR